jgi:hypothetical protein
MRLFLTFLLVAGISCAYASNWNNMNIEEKKFFEDANNLIDKMKPIQNEIEKGISMRKAQDLILSLFGFQRDATLDEFKTIFKPLWLKYHPDKHNNKITKNIATETTQLINSIKAFALNYVNLLAEWAEEKRIDEENRIAEENRKNKEEEDICKDFDGAFATSVIYGGMEITCEIIKPFATADDCDSILSTVAKHAWIINDNVLPDIMLPELCPEVYKDLCDLPCVLSG